MCKLWTVQVECTVEWNIKDDLWESVNTRMLIVFWSLTNLLANVWAELKLQLCQQCDIEIHQQNSRYTTSTLIMYKACLGNLRCLYIVMMHGIQPSVLFYETCIRKVRVICVCCVSSSRFGLGFQCWNMMYFIEVELVPTLKCKT